MKHFLNYKLVCVVLFLQGITCFPVLQVRVPRNEVQYSNGTIVGTYAYADRAGNPIAVKYYADKTGYGVELNSFKTVKLIGSSTTQDAIQNLKPIKEYLEPMKPLLDLAAEIVNFDNQLKAATTKEAMTKHTKTVSHQKQASKVTISNTPDYEKYYQNEVKAPKQCEKDKVRVYLAKDKRKKKNAVESFTTKVTTSCGI